MDKLPNEMLMKIFQNVDQVDQLLNCKIVCKKWYSIIDQRIRLNSLVVSEINDYKILSDKWFDPNESIQFLYDYRYKVEGRRSKIIRFNMKQPLLSRLKKLFIYWRNIWANSINCLKHLEVLGLNCTNLISETEILLNLPNLRVFGCEANDHDHKLVFNCPKLKKVYCYYKPANLSFIHPESIKELHTYYNENFMFDLVDCEYLYITLCRFDENILLKLKKLKELHINIQNLYILSNFIKQKNSLKRTNLKLYFLSVLSDSVSPNILNQLADSFLDRYISIDSIQFYGPNYSYLPDNLYFIQTVDYNVLENYFWANPNQIARGIMKKLYHLGQLILSDQIRDVNQFIGVLKDKIYLNKVWIMAKFMPQNFFDQILSENCSIIKHLHLENKNQLNFDFLLKFKELQHFKTSQQLTSDLIFKLFAKFELLESLEYHYECSKVVIELKLRKKFTIRLDDARNVFNNLEDLLSHLEIYHRKTPFSLDDCLDNFIFNN